LLAKASEAGVQMSAALADYLVPHLPNPDTISVKSEKITINGSSLNVHKVHGEIYGDEVLDLLRKLIMNLAEDEEGLRTLLDKLYDFLMPIIDETLVQTAAAFGDPEDDLILEWIQAYLHNKTLVTEFLFTTITQGYKTALSEFDELEEELASDEDIGSLLSPDSSLKIDLYLDRDLNIVRSDFELTLSPELLGEADGVNGIRLTGTQELWNLNGNVTADVLDDSNGISLDDWHLEDAILSSVEADSFLGQLLAASGLNTKQVLIAVDDFYAYLEDGVTMADVFWLSYDLGIDYVWHEDEGRVVLFDENSGRMATLVVGQNVIYVDGEVREIPKGPEEWSGDLYLPVRAVAEAFGYDVQWDEDFNMVILTKRYF
jgi:hypothetical protein